MKGRWEDWVAVAAGLTLAFSWIWHRMLGPEMGALLLLGVGTILMATLSITRPGAVSTEAAMFGMGALVFVSPWLMAFTANPAAAWTAWIIGAVISVIGIAGVALADRTRRQEPELAWGHTHEPTTEPGQVHHMGDRTEW